MLRRSALLMAVVALAVVAVALVRGPAAAQPSGERVVMTPADGTLTTRFTFVGSGFTPGQNISVRFFPPDGIERRIRTEEGAELVWPVQPDGTFALDVVPMQRFPNASPGDWRVLFCAFGAPTCQQLEFDILP
ncbi:MAG: hypothetical protein ACRDJE_22580 [Dehalococcoidia bacterium]